MLQHVAVAEERVAEVLRKLFTIIVTSIFVQNLHDKYLLCSGAPCRRTRTSVRVINYNKLYFLQLQIEVHIEQSVCQYAQPGHHLSGIGQSIDVCSFHLQENFLTFVCFHRFTCLNICTGWIQSLERGGVHFAEKS